MQSKAGAEEFERQLRTALLSPSHATREVPTFAAYADEFLKTYVLANNKPSEQAMKSCILKQHLLPAFGSMRLHAVKTHGIETFKAGLLAKGLSRKRVNNVLACLGKMLRYAHEIELIETVPKVKLLKIAPPKFDFLTFEELSRLVEAMKGDPQRLALVLLGAEAGLRQGEIMALQWGDVDLVASVLTVRRSSWKGVIGTPKSGRERKVPLTGRLKAALKSVKHLRSELVLCHPDGSALTQSAIEAALRFGCKRAGLRVIGSHTLRHTFCSHLAMRGAPKAIQELVGHSTLTMTLRYMHLAPSALTEAIGLLDNFGQPAGNAAQTAV